MPLRILIVAVFVVGLVGLAGLLGGCSEFVPRDASDSSGTCASPGCSKEAALECGDDGRRVCVDKGGGCLEWQALPCPDDTRCGGAGVCGADDCPELGQTTCQGAGGYTLCSSDPSGFLDWSAYQSCPAGQVCEDGDCAEVACDEDGIRACVDEFSFHVCEAFAEGELQWSPVAKCPDGLVCAGAGNCGQHGCDQVGASHCEGSDSFVLCVVNEQGFRVLGEPASCPAGELCGPDGSCGSHACGPKGTVECDSQTTYHECVPGSDGFLLWESSVACDEGQLCRDGVCDIDACPALGETDCLSTEAFQTCELGETAFLVWSGPTDCPDGQLCVGNGCVEHECAGVGALQCLGESQVQFCEQAESGQFVWGEIKECPGKGTVCKASGLCGKDQCNKDGQSQCENAGAVVLCTLEPSGFLVLSDPEACAQGSVCQNGVCGKDGCVENEKACQNEGVVVCEADPDGFLAYGSVVPCPEGTVCLGAGQCAVDGEFDVANGLLAGRSDITALPGGGLAVAWPESVASTVQVRVRRFDTGGVALEDAQVVVGSVGSIDPQVTVMSLPTASANAVLVGWIDALGNIVVERVDEPGSPSNAPIVITPDATPNNPAPVLANISEGLGAALRIEGSDVFSSHSVHLSIIDGVNDPAPAQLVSTGDDGDYEISSLDARGKPGFGLWAAWTFDADAGNSVALRGVPATGIAVGAVTVLEGSGLKPDNVSLAVADDGRILLAWDAGPDQRDVVVQPVKLTGKADGLPFLASSGNKGAIKPSVAVLADQWLVAWEQPEPDNNSDVVAVVVGASGTVGQPQPIAAAASGPQTDVRVIRLEGGQGKRVGIVWRDGVGLAALRARFLDVP